MSLMGSQEPKFVGTGTPSSATVNLDHTTILTNWADAQIIEQTSVINGVRNYITLGDYSEFVVTVNLYKHTTSPTPKEKFQEIYAFNHQLVQFFPHREGVAVKDSGGTAVNFYISSMIPGYLDTPDFKDILTITFKATGYTDAENSLV